MAEEKGDLKPLIGSQVTYYGRRWYLLMTFSILQVISGFSDNIWHYCRFSAQYTFGWSDKMFLLLVNWLPIVGVLITFPASWLLRRKGIRVMLIAACLFLIVGSGIICFTYHAPTVTWLAHLSQIVTSCATPIMYLCAMALVSTWFPPTQRFPALAIMLLCRFLGGLISRVVTENVIDVTFSTGNVTQDYAIVEPLMHVRYGVLVAAAFASSLVIVYFPSSPPKSDRDQPSEETRNVMADLKSMLSTKNMLLLCVSHALTFGPYWAWKTASSAIFPKSSNWYRTSDLSLTNIGTAAYVAVMVIGIAIISKAGNRLKIAAIICLTLSIGCTFWIATDTLDIYQSTALFNIVTPVYLLSACMTLILPILLLMATEVVFPYCEDAAIALLVWLPYPIQVILFLIQIIPNVGVLWMDWTLFGCVLVSFISMAFCKVEYSKTAVENIALNRLETQ